MSARALTLQLEQEADGRWVAEIVELPGVMAYGPDADSASRAAQALALRVVADRLEHGEPLPAGLAAMFAPAA